MDLPPISAATFSVLGDIAITNYVGVSAVTLSLYDFALNISEEVEFVWSKPIRAGQILYLLNRYLSTAGFILVVSFLLRPPDAPSFCKVWPYFIMVQFGMSTLLINIVLVMRVCAIYSSSRLLRWALIVGCIAVVVETMGVGLAMISLKPWAHLTVPELSLNICTFSVGGGQIAKWRYVYWIYPIVYQALLFVLVFVQAWKNPGVQVKRSLIGVMIRDSTLTFLWNFALQLISIFIWRFNTNGGLTDTPAMMGNALDMALATRLLLNMWGRYYGRDVELSSFPETSYRLEFPLPQTNQQQQSIAQPSTSFWSA